MLGGGATSLSWAESSVSRVNLPGGACFPSMGFVVIDEVFGAKYYPPNSLGRRTGNVRGSTQHPPGAQVAS